MKDFAEHGFSKGLEREFNINFKVCNIEYINYRKIFYGNRKVRKIFLETEKFRKLSIEIEN